MMDPSFSGRAVMPATPGTLVPVPQQHMQTAPAAIPPRKPEDLGALERKFRAYESNKDKEQTESREARRYYHGKHWTDKEIADLNKRKQPVIWDNRIARKVDFLVGVEQRMRRDPKAYPRTPKEEQSADTATACIRYGCDVNRWEQKASEAAHDGLVSGFGVVWVGVGNRQGMPDVIMKAVDVDRFFYDPRSTKPDFSDARYLGMHLWLDIDEAKERWPDHEDKLDSMMDMAGKGSTVLKADADRAIQWADFEHQRVRVIEFWEKRRGGWYYCFFCGDMDLESGDSQYKNAEGESDQPYLAWSPYIDEKGNRYGVVRNMRPLQDEVNHRRSKFLHMINVRQMHARKGDVEDPDKARNELSRPDGYFEHNGEWNKTVGIIDQSHQIQGQVSLLEQATAALENLGPNPGLIGKGGGIADQSGRAILAQRDSGMTELSPVFERLRDWKLRVYRATWARIRNAWTGERFIRVTDDPRAMEFMAVNSYQQHPMTGELMGNNILGDIDVDIILEEGPDSITMQEEEFDQLTKMVQAGLPIPPEIIIEASSLRNKQKILDMIKPLDGPSPKEKLEMDESKARTVKLKADAIAALAKADSLDAQMGNLGTPGQPTNLPEITEGAPGMQGMPPPMDMGMGPEGPMPPGMPPGPPGMPPPDQGAPPMPEMMAPTGGLPIGQNALL